MKFARIVFAIAGGMGLLAIIPMYMAPGTYRYYGVLGPLVAWQLVFFLIAADPKRYRPIMIPAMLEKALWVLTLVFFFVQGKITTAAVLGSTVPHGLLGVLFAIAYFRTRALPSSAQEN
ncbi:MAG TPA: hypothetical protein VKF63_12585 [Terracidiphilus sp.]|nr:hypothetical protein [Terracidiphilus sp.]